jgi:hypothetical protein
MFSDTFHKTMQDAMDEVARRRADPRGMELVTRVERSPYGGGYRVRSMPADFYVDMIADGPMPISTGDIRRRWNDERVT